MPLKAVFIERCSSLDQPGWLQMRVALWPDATADEHRGYMAISLAQPERFLQLMMYDEKRQPIGFIEGSIRSDYVNGTETSPVGFVEGVYVVPAMRRHGVARRLFEAIGDWAKARGCRELASDALLENEASQRAHRALGFKETERVVYFSKKLCNGVRLHLLQRGFYFLPAASARPRSTARATHPCLSTAARRSSDAANFFASASDALLSLTLRRPTPRNAQLTAFFTKLRSSLAAFSMSGRQRR